MEFKLTEEEYQRVREIQHRDRKDGDRFRKATVLIMLHQGYSVTAIESALAIDDNTIRRYCNQYQNYGLDTLLENNFLTYKGKLTDKEEALLCAHLDEYLYEDAASICAHVKQEFGISYSISGMTALLHRLGYVYKHTKKVPSKADEEKQVAFLEETLPELAKEVENGDAVLYYSDGVHPTHNTKTGRAWIKKGTEVEIDCNSGRKRVNINAAVNAFKPEHLVYDEAKSINAQSTKRLCQKLMRKHPGKKIYLVCDNARYNRNKVLGEWTANNRVELIYLPSYSPNLNLIERLWKLMRKKVINSIYYDTYEKFRQGIIDFLDNAKSYKDEIRSLLTLNFRTVGGTSVYAQTNL